MNTVNIRHSEALDCDGKAHGAINAAIESVHASGGGRVTVPAGRWVCGTIVLRSHVELYLSQGAVLVQSSDRDDFPVLPDAQLPPHIDRDGTGLRRMIVAADSEDVAVCGPGVIDADSLDKPPRCSFVLSIMRCRGIRLQDITIRNAKAWTCHLCCCDEVAIRGVRMRNPLETGDGFDIDGCRDVIVSDCDIVTGDDCIVVKTCRNTRSAERIAVSNCILRTSCAAFKIGTETWHDVRAITVSNCVVHHSGRAVQIFSMDGATVEDVVVNGLCIDTNSGIIFNRAIHIDCCRRRWGGLLPGVDCEKLPVGRIRRISISNVSLVTDGRILLTGSDRPLENISLHNIRMHMPWIEDPQRLGEIGDKMQSSMDSFESRQARAALVASDVAGLDVRAFSVSWPEGKPPPADLKAKHELGELLIDPHSDEREEPPFHAMRLQRVSGNVETEDLRASAPGILPVKRMD